MNGLHGTLTLFRLAVRRDRLWLPFWIVFPALIVRVFVTAFRTGFPTPEALRLYAETSVNNFAFGIFYGRLYGSSLGQLVTWRAGFVPVVVSIISLLVMIRHTRTEEETGRRELVGSTAISRYADLAAALFLTGGATLILGLLAALALMSTGLPAAGSLAYGLGLVIVGWAFAAIGALVAQLTTGASAARWLGFSVIGVAFLLRGMGDISAQGGGMLGWVSWLSPLSWGSKLRPFSGERWWFLVVAGCAIATLVLLAANLSQRRDLGSGILPSRPGPERAAPRLRTPFALAWRLNRGSLMGWIIVCAVLGIFLGGVATSIGDLLDSGSPEAQAVIARLGGAGTIIDQYFWAMIRMFALAACAFALQRVLWLQGEETSGRTEYLLAGPVEQVRWAGANFVLTLFGTSVGLLLFGIMAGITHGLIVGDVAGVLPRIITAALVPLPVVWMFAGLGFALFGWTPRLVAAAFVIFLASIFLGWAGEELQLSQWVTDLSAFTHLPIMPGGEMRLLPLVLLSMIAAVLIVSGALGLRRRDLLTG